MSKKAVEAFMGGTILEVKVNIGDAVKPNDLIFILEAMKMENEICSEVSGVVSEINVKAGEVVKANQLIMTIEV